MAVKVTFRTVTAKPEMSRDEVTTWMMGTLTAGGNRLGALQAMAVSTAVPAMVRNLKAMHDSGKCLQVTGGDGSVYAVTCTRAGSVLHHAYTFRVQQVA